MASLPLNVVLRSWNLSSGRLHCIPPSRPPIDFLSSEFRRRSKASLTWDFRTLNPKSTLTPIIPITPKKVFLPNVSSSSGCNFPERLDKKIFRYRAEQYSRAFAEFIWDYFEEKVDSQTLLMVGSVLMTLVGARTLFCLAIFIASLRILLSIQKRRWASVLEEMEEKIKEASKTQDSPEEKSSIKTEMGIPLEIVDDSPRRYH